MKAGEPSATALLIAGATIYSAASRDASIPVPPEAVEWCERLLRATPKGRRLLRLARHPFGRRAAALLERLTIPGITRHYQLRKRWIERAWRSAASEGFRRLIVLGAGLDTLAIREAARDSTLDCIEIDHPATQSVKRLALEGSAESRSIRLIAADLSSQDPDLLLDAPSGGGSLLAPGVPTVIVAEGLLMYFAEARVRGILTSLARLPVPRARLIVTHMERIPGRRTGFTPHSRLVDLWLRLRGEPFLWAATDDEARQLIESCGWRVRDGCRAESLAGALGVPGGSGLRGENIMVADRENSSSVGDRRD